MYVVHLHDKSGNIYLMPEIDVSFEDFRNPLEIFSFGVKQFQTKKEAKVFMYRHWHAIKQLEDVEGYEIIKDSGDILDFHIFISGSNKYGN